MRQAQRRQDRLVTNTQTRTLAGQVRRPTRLRLASAAALSCYGGQVGAPSLPGCSPSCPSGISRLTTTAPWAPQNQHQWDMRMEKHRQDLRGSKDQRFTGFLFLASGFLKEIPKPKTRTWILQKRRKGLATLRHAQGKVMANPLCCLEAATGFEPVYNGFADRCLTTWLCRRAKTRFH